MLTCYAIGAATPSSSILSHFLVKVNAFSHLYTNFVFVSYFLSFLNLYTEKYADLQNLGPRCFFVLIPGTNENSVLAAGHFNSVRLAHLAKLVHKPKILRHAGIALFFLTLLRAYSYRHKLK